MTYLLTRRLSILCLVHGLWFGLAPAWGAAGLPLEFDLPSKNSIVVERYPAPGQDLLLWLPSESGLGEGDKIVAAALANLGVEVWLADLVAAHFLPAVASSVDRIPAGDVAAVLTAAQRTTGKKVYVLGPGRGALLALYGQYEHRRQGKAALGGVVLLSPKLFRVDPEPGLEPELSPIVHVSNAPILIMQPNKSPWHWQMQRFVRSLSAAGSDVYLWSLANVRDRFYYRPDAQPAEDRMATRLPGMLARALPLLASYAGAARGPGATVTAPEAPPPKAERGLRAFRGTPQPPPLRLMDLEGAWHDLADYRGQVVMVNFWASWCPPCVHEMPSMERLRQRYSDRPVRILAVNMAEDPAVVRRFLVDVVQVGFTVLMDTDGAVLQRWKVSAFPTSFLIGRRGTIRYALYGAIDWDQPDVHDKIQRLLAEQP